MTTCGSRAPFARGRLWWPRPARPAIVVPFAVALTAIVAALAFTLSGAAGPPMADLYVYRGAIRSLLAGGGLYDWAAANGDPFTYPPFAALVLAPLVVLPEAAMVSLFVAAELAALAAIVGLTVRHWPGGAIPALLPRASGRLALAATVAAVFAVSAPVQSNLRFGQVSILLTAACLWAALRTEDPAAGTARPHVSVAGLAIGLTAAIKLLPLVFIPYLWLTGRRRAAGHAAAAFAGATAFAWWLWPAASLRYWNTELWAGRYGGLVAPRNQSLLGALHRLGLGEAAPAVWLATAVLLSPAILALACRLQRAGHELAAVACVGAATVLLSPTSWAHHQTWLVLGAACVVSARPARQAAWQLAVVAGMSINTFALGAIVGPVGLIAANSRVLLALAVALCAPLLALRHAGARGYSPPGWRRALREIVAGRGASSAAAAPGNSG